MGHVIRQQYIDPLRKTLEIRDIHIDITMLRPEESKAPEPQFYVIIEQAGHVRGIPPFSPIFYNVGDIIQFLLDAKPTTPPPGCRRTRLIEPNDGLKFVLKDVGPQGLQATVGDPVAIISDLEEQPEQTAYGTIKSVQENVIEVYSHLSMPSFKCGAFVQNLSNKWDRRHNITGPKSLIIRPSQPIGAIKTDKDGLLWLLLSKPMNEGLVECIDCYVRTTPFQEILPHWLPDVMDGNAQNAKHHLQTYEGGTAAGGGLIADLATHTPLYIGLVGKDSPGEDANRSQIKILRAITASLESDHRDEALQQIDNPPPESCS